MAHPAVFQVSVDLDETELFKFLKEQGRQLAINGWHKEAHDNALIMGRLFRRELRRRLAN